MATATAMAYTPECVEMVDREKLHLIRIQETNTMFGQRKYVLP